MGPSLDAAWRFGLKTNPDLFPKDRRAEKRLQSSTYIIKSNVPIFESLARAPRTTAWKVLATKPYPLFENYHYRFKMFPLTL